MIILKKTIEILQNIVSRKGSSKVLTFSISTCIQSTSIVGNDKYVSRATFGKRNSSWRRRCKDTDITSKRSSSIIDSTKSGSFLTEKGKKIVKQLQKTVPFECEIKKCRLVSGKKTMP